MKLDVKRLAWAAMLVWAGWYTVCAFLVAVAPAQTQSVFSYVFHYELTGSRPITWAAYCFGMLGTTAWIGLFVASIGWCFNALGRDQQVSVLPQHGSTRAA